MILRAVSRMSSHVFGSHGRRRPRLEDRLGVPDAARVGAERHRVDAAVVCAARFACAFVELRPLVPVGEVVVEVQEVARVDVAAHAERVFVEDVGRRVGTLLHEGELRAVVAFIGDDRLELDRHPGGVRGLELGLDLLEEVVECDEAVGLLVDDADRVGVAVASVVGAAADESDGRGRHDGEPDGGACAMHSARAPLLEWIAVARSRPREIVNRMELVDKGTDDSWPSRYRNVT